MERKPVVYVVDDEPEVRDAMRLTLEMMDLEVVCFATGQQFLDQHDPTRVACLIVDLRMPGMSGQALLEALTARGSTIPAIMVSGHGDIPAAVRALNAGAINFLEKPYRVNALRENVERALKLARERRHEVVQETAIYERLSQLSAEERQVLHLTVAGKPDKAIASRMNLSIRTIQFRRASLMKKLGVRSRADLVGIARIDPEPPEFA